MLKPLVELGLSVVLQRSVHIEEGGIGDIFGLKDGDGRLARAYGTGNVIGRTTGHIENVGIMIVTGKALLDRLRNAPVLFNGARNLVAVTAGGGNVVVQGGRAAAITKGLVGPAGLFAGSTYNIRHEVAGGLTSGKNVGKPANEVAGATANARKVPDAPVRTGGRLGNQATRAHVGDVAAELESRGWRVTGGGGLRAEEYLPGPGGGRLGSNWVDITAVKNGRTLRINTIDTLADGLTPTAREAAAAAAIRAKTGEHLLLVPKPK